MRSEFTSENDDVRPQNKSRPAGGTNSRPDDHWGVFVAPPSTNTPIDGWHVLHRGFDTLTLSIRAMLPDDFLDHLTASKAKAEEEREPVLTEFKGIPFQIYHHGGQGYSFTLSEGSFGATWFLKKPNAKDPWSVRLSFGSDFLATKGLGAAKAHCDRVMALWGMPYKEDAVSIARADYCVDILAPGFVLNPDNLVLPPRTNRRDYFGTDEAQSHGCSGRYTSVTAGQVSNRQVVIYDKRTEVVKRRKTHWLHIWQANLNRGLGHAAPQLDLSSSPIWRVELRAGKKALKERWGITTWKDFFVQFGDLSRHTAEVVRYCDPDGTDSNRARWPNHPLWDIVVAEVNDDLTEMRSGVEPDLVKEVHREVQISTQLANIFGNTITLAALNGVEYDGFAAHFDNLPQQLKAMASASPKRTRQKLQTAKDRYIFKSGR